MSTEIKTRKSQKKWLKVLQFLAAYLVAAWTFLQFVDWALIRYNISPYWVDLLLWIFIGITPSLLIYFYNQERLNKKVLKLREKIIFPLNVVLIMVVTYFGFGNSDLGATTTKIDYTTEQGEQASVLITKEEFRKTIGIFNFESKTKDSALAWMEWGITILLHEDLSQNKNLITYPNSFESTTEKVNNAKIFYDTYIDGEYDLIDSTYIITAFIRNSSNAEIISKETVRGTNFLNLIDSITGFVTDKYSSREFKSPKYLDLNLEEFTSSSLKAVEHYTKGEHENAIKEDSTFALAYLTSGKRNLNYSTSKFEERKLADKAYEYRSKLPLQKQGEALILRNLAYEQFEDAEELLKIQLQVDPTDQSYNRMLSSLYGRTKNIEAYVDYAKEAYEKNSNPSNGLNYLNSVLIQEDYDRILKELKVLEFTLPSNNEIFSLKLVPQLLMGDIEAASKTQNKIKLLHPDWENFTTVYDKAIVYLKDHKATNERMRKFEGRYRSETGEQIFSYWIEKNTLLQYVSNQLIQVKVLSGDHSLVSGHVIYRYTAEATFYSDKDNRFYAFKNEQNNLSGSETFWYWKIDDHISKAESLLEAGKLDSAEIAYKKAIDINPNHYYLKDALAHIEYVKSKDSIGLLNQYKEVEGAYGPRKFWIEEGKLFYKRDRLVKLELLPISENRYICLSQLGTNFEFEYRDGKSLASYAWRFDNEKDEWVKLDTKDNYFERN